MSWLFSRALVAASLGDICSDGRPSAQSKKTQDAPEFWLLGKTTDFFHSSRFGQMWKPLTEQLGGALLMWCQAARPAKASQPLALDSGLMIHDQNSSSKCSVLLARFDLDSCSWKIRQSFGEKDLPWSSVDLPKSGMLAGGILSQLPEWVDSISARDSSLLPTLTKTNAHGNEYTRDGGKKGKERLSLVGLSKRGLLPTLCKRDHKDCGENTDFTRIKEKSKLAGFVNGPLHPIWCEWFMGFPEGWSELKALETRKFREWCRQHGNSSPKDYSK